MLRIREAGEAAGRVRQVHSEHALSYGLPAHVPPLHDGLPAEAADSVRGVRVQHGRSVRRLGAGRVDRRSAGSLQRGPAARLPVLDKESEPVYGTGSTITGPEDSFWWSDYHNTFVSMEPLLQPFEGVGAQAVKKVGWCIIGSMTGPGSKAHQPKREWVESIVTDAKTAGVPVFMKDNLKGVWGDQLLRECPEGIDLADKKAVAEWDGE